MRNPANIMGKAEGMMIFRTRVQVLSFNTFATFRWSLSIEATPRPLLANVGYRAHRATVTAELMNDFSNQASSGLVVYNAPTQIMTMGSHARGETGLKI